MLNIDRLIIKAKKKCGTTALRLSLGFVSPVDGGRWEAHGQLWNYIPYNKAGHKLEIATCICDSIEDALEALDQLSEEYPNDRNVRIIIDSLEGD
ncbi:hypothetical protein D3Z53_26670 [Lachnospiraceae bacterium]|nr:hypothetical protein [uncultured Schaedlerella sp.]EOS39738.1 hypothetical protein C808_01544 [Lachnospiraceae bacterium M18-1]NBI61454.1 hypothetical protein [Lachnospiraceae bacterium]